MYIKRGLEAIIKNYLNTKEIIVVVGPRQSGKTTMIKNILSTLKDVNQVSFDDLETLSLFINDINSFIELHIKDYKYVFIDEIQYAPESGRSLKYIHDSFDTKLFVSGSSAAEISINSLKYLVGRVFIFKLLPFSFGGFLLSKDPNLKSLFVKKKYGREISVILNRNLDEFLTYGGYPRVVISKDKSEKITVLKNIYNTLLLKEVKDLFSISSNDKLEILIKGLAYQIGNLINYSELCQLSGLNFITLKKYLNILEELFVCKRCYPLSNNPRQELVKTPKIYFYDYGLRNVIISNFHSNNTDNGFLFENLIFAEFLKKEIELKYWRTKSGAEVDFVHNSAPIEVKILPKTSRSFYSFLNKFKPKNGYIVSRHEKESVFVNGTEINFVPFIKFI